MGKRRTGKIEAKARRLGARRRAEVGREGRSLLRTITTNTITNKAVPRQRSSILRLTSA
jgi:hypothetical protein